MNQKYVMINALRVYELKTCDKYEMLSSFLADHVLTLQAFTEEHEKPPPPLQGSLKDMFTETREALVKFVSPVISAVGLTVSEKYSYESVRYNL